MKTRHTYILILFFLSINTNLVYSQTDFTMQIVLDKAVDAGDLKLFPGVRDKNSYWYLPNKLRLAKNDDGTPKLSFIKWVHNETNGTDEGIGGGVLHCVFGFEITDEELAEAKQELKKINANGKIIGSVVYKSGTVTVSVPKIADPEKEEVVSVSPAPTMEGSYVAINLQLDKRSATLLWDSFDTPNPLVIFNFNMVLAGYNSPMDVKITIKRDQVYSNQSFQAGLASPWLNAEIGIFIEDLIDKGAITIEQVGANFSKEKAIDAAIAAATKEFFTPLGSSEGPSLSHLTKDIKQNSSYLDKASKLLNEARGNAKKERNEVIAKNRKEQERVDAINKKNIEESNANNSPSSNNDKPENEQVKPEKNENKTDSIPKKSVGKGIGGRSKKPSKDNNFKSNAEPGEVTVKSDNPVESTVLDPVEAKLQDVPEVPSVALVASYVFKKTKISGEKIIQFKESQPITLPMPFGGNLGVSRSNCNSCFKEVNLDDDVYKQREILTLLDGLDEKDFDKYINYGTAQLRKKHQSGEFTHKEIRITRKNFNKEGNLFKMIYGWKGDNNRSKWFNYEYKVAWSFFGGHNIETDWESTNSNTINLSAPLQRKIISIQAQKSLLEDKNVRAVYVKIFYNLGGEEQLKQYTIDVKKDVINGEVEIMLPKNIQEYDYEITWRLWGNEEKKSERKTTNFETLYIDEILN